MPYEKQLLIALLISSIFLNGCEKKKQENSVPNFMPAQKYKGQGFGEDGDKELKELIKNIEKNMNTVVNNSTEIIFI